MNLKKTSHCLNCGTSISESNYCHHCGQLNTDKRISSKELVTDFLGDYFTFDSKFFRSLIPLLLKPGFLSREYVAGRRVNYIFPLRLYLFTTFIFFFVVAVMAKIDPPKVEIAGNSNNAAVTASLDSIFTEYDTEIPENVKADILSKIDSSFALKEKSGNKSNIVFMNGDSTDSQIGKYFIHKIKYLADKGSEGASLFWKEVINQIPKIFFILLPLFALILKLLFIRHKIYYIEHLIFSVHVHTFVFLFLIITIFLPEWYIILAVILGIIVYLFMALRRFYQQSYFKIFLKFNILMFCYTMLMIPAFVILVLLAVVSI